MAAAVNAPDAVILTVVVARDVAAIADAVHSVELYDSVLDFKLNIENSVSCLVFI